MRVHEVLCRKPEFDWCLVHVQSVIRKFDDHPKLKQFSTSKTICMHGACIYPFLLCLHIFLRNALLTDESNVNTFDTNYFVIEILP